MLVKVSDLRHLDVINVEEGSYLGTVCDVDLDPKSGRINSLVIGRPRPFFPWRSGKGAQEIPWREVVLFGIDVILVKNRTWHR